MFWTLLAKVMGPVMLLLFGGAIVLWPLHKFGLITEEKANRIIRPLLIVFFALLGVGIIGAIFSGNSSSRGGGRYWEALHGDEDPMDAIMERALSEPPPTREEIKELWEVDDWEQRSVDSSVFEDINYNRMSHTVKVTFRSGDEYYYWDVPRTVYDRWVRAPSKGQFFQAHIRGQYDEERLE